MTLSLEQRKRQAELIGRRVRGTTPAQLRIERGGVCAECGGPLPCSRCAAEPQSEPAERRTKRRAPVVNHTAHARMEYDLIMAQEGRTTPTTRRTVRKVDAVAEARRDYDRMRREAGR